MFTPPPSPLPRANHGHDDQGYIDEDFDLAGEGDVSTPSSSSSFQMISSPSPSSPLPSSSSPTLHPTFSIPKPPPTSLSSPPPPKKKHRTTHSTSLQLQSVQERKQKIGQRTKWIALLLPLVVILITVGSKVYGFRRHTVLSSGSRPLGLRKRDTQNNGPIPTTGTFPHTEPLTTGTAATSLTASGSSSASSVQTLAGTAQPVPTVPSPTGTESIILPTPFPQPWDSDVGQNFSTLTCSNFFQNMTNSESFRSCRPFGLLVGTSSEIVEAQNNLTLLNSLIYGTCNTKTPYQQCVSNMAGFALGLEKACAKELSDRNQMVVNGMLGLQSFSLMYNAGCLTDNTTNSYCYLNAVHNTNPSDLFLYQIPLGLPLPSVSGIAPTCSSCSKNLLALYAQALHAGTGSSVLGQSQGGISTEGDAGAKSWIEMLGKDYESAVGVGERTCGSGFLDTTVGNGAPRQMRGLSNLGLLLTTLVLGWAFVW